LEQGEAFIRDAAAKRGIDPEIALRVADSEGGRAAPGLVGKFPTGWSWWQYQLHYGGAGYEHFGTVAGMGNGFTELTGWAPGDPNAWRDAARYGLNRAKASGWGAWYGAAHVGIGKWDGIDRSFMWDANSERWDYEGIVPVSPSVMVTYNRNEPVHLQNRSYDCSQEAIEWSLWSLGRRPDDDWMEGSLINGGYLRPDVGCTDATGAGLARWVRENYGEDGFDANNEVNVSWDWIKLEGCAIPPGDGSGHGYPVLIGGRQWYHWAAVRDFDPDSGRLLIANSAPGYGGVGQALTEADWQRLGPFNAVRIWHPDLLEPAAPPIVPPAVPTDTRLPRVRQLAEEIIAVSEESWP
jgi:hypothetical protein